MKKAFMILLMIGSVVLSLSSQNCTACTQTISTSSFTPIIAGVGDKICITTSGIVNAPVTISGGEICNQGVINGSITTSGGVINNFGTINASVLNLGGNHIFNNNNIVEVASNYSGTNTVEFYNNGGMSIAGNMNNSAYFYTHCIITVGGTFNNSGTCEGPTIGCGGFVVAGGATNTNFFGADNSYIDMCDSANGGNWTAQNGTLGTNVTNCSCNDHCSTAIGIPVNDASKVTVKVYPNPVKTFFTLTFQTNVGEPYDVYIYNSFGALERVLSDNTLNQLTIQRGGLPAGVYLYSIMSKGKIIAEGKLLFN